MAVQIHEDLETRTELQDIIRASNYRQSNEAVRTLFYTVGDPDKPSTWAPSPYAKQDGKMPV